MHINVRLLLPFLIAVMCTFIAASIAHSQFVLFALKDLGIQISSSDWLAMTASDLVGLLPGYGGVIFLTLLLAFWGTNRLLKKCRGLPDTCYGIAGFSAMALALLAMQPLLGVTLIAGAREPLGFVLQCAAGGWGGWVFARLQPADSPR